MSWPGTSMGNLTLANSKRFPILPHSIINLSNFCQQRQVHLITQSLLLWRKNQSSLLLWRKNQSSTTPNWSLVSARINHTQKTSPDTCVYFEVTHYHKLTLWYFLELWVQNLFIIHWWGYPHLLWLHFLSLMHHFSKNVISVTDNEGSLFSHNSHHYL